MPNVFKIAGRHGKPSGRYYGKVRLSPGVWRRVVLLTGKRASERKLRDLQRRAGLRRAAAPGDAEDLATCPIGRVVDRYVASMKVRKLDPEHVRISEWLLRRMITLGGWRGLADVTAEAVEDVLRQPDAAGATAGYQNKFVKRAKAFVRWALPDGAPNPLRRLHQVREKGAARRRERRAATADQVVALFALDMPAQRRLAYALAAFNGLRRGEIKRDDLRRLRCHQVHLDAPIPFLSLGRKQACDDATDEIPLHPYVIELLRGAGPGDANDAVVPAVPDVRTLTADWEQTGVPFADARGRRLDFHALRHTFETSLDRAQVSRATKKKLMRHANEDVTDGYTHAELAEMRAALDRIPAPRAAASSAPVPAVPVAADGGHGAGVATPHAEAASPELPGAGQESGIMDDELRVILGRWPTLPASLRQAVGLLVSSIRPDADTPG